MKSILLTMFLLIGFNSFTQDTILSNKGRLELIADELDISEEQAYQSLVKEQRIQAYRNLMIYATMFLALYTLKRSFKIGKGEIKDSGDRKEMYLAYTETCNKMVKDETSSWTIKDILDKVQHPFSYSSRDETMEIKKIIFVVLSILIFSASLIYNSIMLGDTFTGLFNPEYGALEQLEFLNK